MQKEQNIYDNDTFFKGYTALRSNELSANNVEEKPALFAMMPSLEGKRVLDLGCGYGENCLAFAQMGASYVLGIDISQNMLAVANQQNTRPNVEYRHLSMNDLDQLDEKFDVVVSSLAFHYIEDFSHLIKSVAGVLRQGGILLFSQEHPIATAPVDGIKWKTGEKYIEGMLLTDYPKEGVREVFWFVDGLIKYHRKTATIINTLIEHGFAILAIDEPTVSDELIEKENCLSRCLHAPDYLFVKARLGN